MPNRFRIYLTTHYPGDFGQTISPAMQFLTSPFWDRWEECLTLATVVRRVCGEHPTNASSHG